MAHQTKPGVGRRARTLRRIRYFLATLGIIAFAPIHAQTNLDLRNQAKNIDFSGASATKVWKTGASLPPSCSVGEGFFLLGNGPKVYVCSTTDVWNTVTPSVAGNGADVQTVNGTLAVNAVPAIDSTGTEVNSGCTANAAAMICAGGFNGGTGATRLTATEGTPPSPPSTGQQTLYIESSDHSLRTIDEGSLVRRYATIDGNETLTAKTMINPSVGSSAFTSLMANEGSTGTIINKLAKLIGAPSTAVLPSITDTAGIVGIVVSGAGTSGAASIAIGGQANCLFDSATLAGDYVTTSAVNAGACHDSGTSYASGVQIVGRVLSTNNSAGTYNVQLFPPEQRSATAAVAPASTFDPLDFTTAWWRDEMTTNTQWYLFAYNGGGMTYGDYSFGDANHPGTFDLYSGSDATNLAKLMLVWGNSSEVMHYPTGASWQMHWIVKLGTIANAKYDLGFSDHTGQNALTVTFDPSRSSNWIGVVRYAGTDTIVDLGIAGSTSSWFRLSLRSDGTSIFYSVDNGAEKSACPSGCNVTATNGLPGSQIVPVASVTNKIAGSNAIIIDLFALQFTGLSR